MIQGSRCPAHVCGEAAHVASGAACETAGRASYLVVPEGSRSVSPLTYASTGPTGRAMSAPTGTHGVAANPAHRCRMSRSGRVVDRAGILTGTGGTTCALATSTSVNR